MAEKDILGESARGRSKLGRITRRVFLISGATVAGGLAVGVGWLSLQGRGMPEDFAKGGPDGSTALNAWVRIEPDGWVTVATPRAEMGQGAQTGLAILVAEELDMPLDRIRVEHPDAHGVYANAGIALQATGLIDQEGGALRWAISKAFAAVELVLTGGSSSIPDGWVSMRRAGAAAREMLKAAAAARWGAPIGALATEDGTVRHPNGVDILTYAELAAEAAAEDPPSDPALRPPSAFRLIGRDQPRLDIPDKVTGRAQYGIDVTEETVGGPMIYAAVKNCPVLGGRITAFDADAAQSRPGVIAVMTVPGGVAVVADNTWRAMSAARDLPIEVDGGEGSGFSTAAFEDELEGLLERPPSHVFEEEGDVAEALRGAATRVEATYAAPFLAHACLEPMNATVRINRDGGAEVWAPTQSPTVARWAVSSSTSVSTGDVRVHVPYLGGGFGRRAEADVIAQAATVAAAFRGQAVKLVWSREEDMRRAVYRPAAAARFRGGLDAEGRIVGLDAHLACQAAEFEFAERAVPIGGFGAEEAATSVEGADKQPYAYGACRIAHSLARSPAQVGFWRAVGHSQNAFFKESFIDEMAAAAGADPVAFRRAHLSDSPAHLAVLEAVADLAGWPGPATPAPGVGFGVALHESFRSIVGQVAQVRVEGEDIRVEKVWCAVDCGVAVNPDSVRAQIEGAVIFGLTAALYGRIDIEDGVVVQGNFPDYEMVRLEETPEISVRILERDRYPGGAGEIGLPPLAPAVANAVFAASGRRLRRTPFLTV